MADNVVADLGAGGSTFGSDDIGGVQYPRNKIIIGADNTNDGDVSASNPLPVRQTAIGVIRTHATSAALAAASSATLTGAQIASGKTGYLLYCSAFSTVPIQVVLQTVLNGVATTIITAGAPAGVAWQFSSPARELIQQVESATAGFDGFQVVITNRGNTDAADVYATFLSEEL